MKTQPNGLIVGPARFIAGQFAQGMLQVPDAQQAAVVSRSEENGKAYAEKYGFCFLLHGFPGHAGGSPADVVYIATPNDTHIDYVSQALNAGVAVLCEKPMADNVPQTEEMVRLAKEKQYAFLWRPWTRWRWRYAGHGSGSKGKSGRRSPFIPFIPSWPTLMTA